MNIKIIIAGFLVVGLAIGGVFYKTISKDRQAVYQPRTMNNVVSGQAGYAEYMHMLKADPATGKIDYNLVEQVRAEIELKGKKNDKAALGLNWTQMGPDNVGGRTRAILVDKFNANIVYAGGVSGGLFVSTNASSSWTPVTGMQGLLGENLSVSCITQTDNGRIFFGTGSIFEVNPGFSIGGSGFIGNGVYEYVPSTGMVLPVLVESNTPPNNNPIGTLTYVNAIASKENRLYLATGDGMVWADPDVGGIYPSMFSGWTNPIEVVPGTPEANICQDIDIASDGAMLVCFKNKVYTSSNDAFGSFTKTTKTGERLSAAIAPNNPNVYYVVRSTGFGVLAGLEISLDKGVNWDVIVPGGVPSIDPFGGQGIYDQAIAVDPNDWGNILVGGIRLFSWKYTSGSNPIGGSWLQAASLTSLPINNPFYVHADNHTIIWGSSGTVYIGGDGGVFKSTDNTTTWSARNFGYNTTSFYDVATAANGWIVGGSQDNGDLLFSFGSFGSATPLGASQSRPSDGQLAGDGFDVAFSNQGAFPIMYATAQYGSLWRATNSLGGIGFFNLELDTLLNPDPQPLVELESFHTVIENWESNDDATSVDSIKIMFDAAGTVIAPGDTVFAGETILAGDTIHYQSLTNGNPLTYIVPSDITLSIPIDSLKLIDPIQNRFVLATSNGIYFTRDASRINVLAEWYRISSVTNVICMEFSADGNHLFIGTQSGGVKRVSNLNLANDSLLDNRTVGNVLDSADGMGTSGVITGIAADPNDINNIIVTTGGYSTADKVYRCTNAIAPTVFTCEAIQGSGGSALPKMPVYDAVIDFTDNDQVIIGTEWGVWTTDNAFSAAASAVVWTDESDNGMTHVPVHGVVQQQLRSHQAVNSGYIYLGTHGRGFYRTADLYTAVDENDFTEFGDKNKFVSNLSVYPNPLNTNGVVEFDLNKNLATKIKIYNLTGSLVKTYDLGKLTKGNHKENINVSSLSVGAYIVSLESDSERSVAKFMITR